ncbi:hypothetical protein MGG_17276 [Pyricularia oryzae 70-15]|uniref:Uncharacterized protein n=3 Tax=Pyricularia oryzae TaxID=318829 RepID=G4NAG4_PYRO7|nr:uncharacterized protein MGG_17276 [Pyricularia oryzae 70-15]EHA51302.1 hypothetical protein MGG_17276 [Pyricularia oryzae 70-15]ELQ35532.1 hypothetical protein OOU_Y34scaffold00705g5 [Pyricularia oryzae Y34]
MALSRVDGLSLCRTVLALAVLDVTNKNQDALISVLFNARRSLVRSEELTFRGCRSSSRSTKRRRCSCRHTS